MRPMTKTARFIPEAKVRDIKARLYKKGITYKEIADAAGVKVGSVWHVIGGYGKSKKIMTAISGLLGETVEKTWGKAA